MVPDAVASINASHIHVHSQLQINACSCTALQDTQCPSDPRSDSMKVISSTDVEHDKWTLNNFYDTIPTTITGTKIIMCQKERNHPK